MSAPVAVVCGAVDAGQVLERCPDCGGLRAAGRPHGFDPVAERVSNAAAQRVIASLVEQDASPLRVQVHVPWPADEPPAQAGYPRINRLPSWEDIYVIVDGRAVMNVERVRIDARQGEPVRVQLDILGAEVLVDAPLDETTREAIARLDKRVDLVAGLGESLSNAVMKIQQEQVAGLPPRMYPGARVRMADGRTGTVRDVDGGLATSTVQCDENGFEGSGRPVRVATASLVPYP